MTEYRYSQSLNIKTLIASFIALIIAFGFYTGANKVGGMYIESLYMSHSAVSARKAEIYTDFHRYINANNVHGNDAETVQKWCTRNEYYSLLVFKDNQLLYKVDSEGYEYVANMDDFSVIKYQHDYGKRYPIFFVDSSYHIAILDTSEQYEYKLLNIISLIVAILIFFFAIILHMQHETQRIIDLARQTYYVSMGDLDAPLRLNGHDELSILSGEIDNMRDNIIQRIENEHRAYNSSADLITAISHDIRTPMTSVIGYLGILCDSKLTDTEKDRQLLNAAYSKALDLKDLTDELFRYFLVFGKSDPKLDMDTFDAEVFFGQLLAEMQFELEDMGFKVENRFIADSVRVTVDPMYAKRITGNIISNIKKYGERSEPVIISSSRFADRLTVTVSNTIIKQKDRVESNKIGIRTCEKIMQLMGGEFISHSENDTVYYSELSFRVF